MFNRLIRYFFIAVSGLLSLLHGVSAHAQSYTVELNKTQILHLPIPAAAIVVGNPEIADVSVHSQDTIFIIGRGYGETNIIVLDKYGQTVLNAVVRVGQELSSTGIRVYKIGKGRETYSCAPYCLPAPILGDAPSFMGKFQGNNTIINNTTVSAPTGLPGTANAFNVGPGPNSVTPRNIDGDFSRTAPR